MTPERRYYVYIMSDKSRRLYTGVTNNVHRRAYEHKHKRIQGFTSRYVFDMLVHVERFSTIHAAVAREKEIKGWLRARKIALIESKNPTWADLSAGWYAHDEAPWPTEP